jgi:hypothetical protein
MADTNPNSISEEEFAAVYEVVSKKLLIEKKTEVENSYDGIFATMLTKFKDEFDTSGLTNEDIAIAKSQFFANAFNTLESQAHQTTLHILDSKASETLVNAKVKLTEREILGYDDGLRIKKAEFQGNVTSFAINADATNAQEVLNEFNKSIDEITDYKTFGVVSINSILATDVLVSGSISGIFVKDGDTVSVTANSITTISTITSAGNYEVVVDSANLISAETVIVSCDISDSDGNTITITSLAIVV